MAKKPTKPEPAIIVRDLSPEEQELRDKFAGIFAAGMYANSDLVKKAAADWCQSGGPSPCCVAEWFAGMAYEGADAMLRARKEPHNA